MRFVVGNKVTDDTNNAPIPDELNPTNWPLQVTDVDKVYNFQRGGDDLWTINGESFSDLENRVIAQPQQVCTILRICK